MQRFDKNIWDLFLENGRRIPEPTVYKVAWQIINVLEYIHSRAYVHADIKGANLLLDLKSQSQVYLVDFGFASPYTTKDYKLDPKKAHNGTIEYTSRDGHMGVPTMRGDLEILLYNVIQWLCGVLPWEKNLKDASWVQQQKENAFKKPKEFLQECFKASEIPAPVTEFMTLLIKLDYKGSPKYNEFRDVIVEGLKKLDDIPTGILQFKADDGWNLKTSYDPYSPDSPSEDELAIAEMENHFCFDDSWLTQVDGIPGHLCETWFGEE